MFYTRCVISGSDGIRDKLNRELDQVCGDTFCEGDYSNITPPSVFCSVTSKDATVHDCAWTVTTLRTFT